MFISQYVFQAHGKNLENQYQVSYITAFCTSSRHASKNHNMKENVKDIQLTQLLGGRGVPSGAVEPECQI